MAQLKLNFQWCGKRIYRDPETKEIHVNMKTYHSQLKPVTIPGSRRSNLEAPFRGEDPTWAPWIASMVGRSGQV